MESRLKVHFIGIGAPRAGTTWLYECLREHPGISVSSVKEVHFFDKDENFKRGYDFYEKLLSPRNSTKIMGEITPAYLACADCPAKMANLLPEAKLIVCLRDPIDRFISGYKYTSRRSGLMENPQTITEAAESNVALLEPGFYAKHLRRYLTYFPREQMHIILYEDIEKRPEETLRNVYRYLGGDEHFKASSARSIVNSSETTEPIGKIPVVSRLVYAIGKRVKKPHPGRLGQRLPVVLKKLGVYTLGRKILYLNLKIPKAAVRENNRNDKELIQVRAKLKKLYKSDTADLERLLNRKLDWMAD